MRHLVIAAVVLAASAGTARAQDVEAGKSAAGVCLACHMIGEEGATVGPTLNGLDGRKAGTVEGYNYSEANKNSGLTWNEKEFAEYIKDPKAKIPKTKMFFPGIHSNNPDADAKKIANLWAYLAQFKADGTKK